MKYSINVNVIQQRIIKRVKITNRNSPLNSVSLKVERKPTHCRKVYSLNLIIMSRCYRSGGFKWGSKIWSYCPPELVFTPPFRLVDVKALGSSRPKTMIGGKQGHALCKILSIQ